MAQPQICGAWPVFISNKKSPLSWRARASSLLEASDCVQFMLVVGIFFSNASFSRTSIDSVADWPYLFRTDQDIRQTFNRLLAPERVSQGVLGEILDAKQLSEVRDRFFAAKAQRRPEDNSLKIQLRGLLRKLIECTPGLGQLVFTQGRNNGSEFDTLRRAALCVALQEELPRFKAGLPERLLFEAVPLTDQDKPLSDESRSFHNL